MFFKFFNQSKDTEICDSTKFLSLYFYFKFYSSGGARKQANMAADPDAVAKASYL